jgi:hypothetical protein
MAEISTPLSFFILCLGWVWLQSPDHYQSLFCAYDVYGYNLKIITNLYSVSRIGMATISRSLSIVLCLGCVWLQYPDHF